MSEKDRLKEAALTFARHWNNLAAHDDAKVTGARQLYDAARQYAQAEREQGPKWYFVTYSWSLPNGDSGYGQACYQLNRPLRRPDIQVLREQIIKDLPAELHGAKVILLNWLHLEGE